jgi:hypothetical protein
VEGRHENHHDHDPDEEGNQGVVPATDHVDPIDYSASWCYCMRFSCEGVRPRASMSTLVDKEALVPLVESETFIRAFSPGSTLEPGLKIFRRRVPKCPLETPTL